MGGTVIAASVTLQANDNDTLFDLMPPASTIDPATGQSTAPPGTPPTTKGAFSGSLFDFEASADIIVEKDASIEAVSGNVAASAVIEQNRSLIDLFGDALAGINVINVKVGSADITVRGSIKARNNVSLTSRATVVMKASNEMLASAFVPLAVVVAVTDVSVNILDHAVVEAVLGSVKASADSNVSLTATANTGKLPISLATAVGVNDAHIKVGGDSRIIAKGDVSLTASAITLLNAKASRGALSGNTSVYITAEVVVQDSCAEVTDRAEITAGGNVTVSSTANQTSTAIATSAKPAGAAAGGGSSTKEGMASIKEMFGEIASVFAANAKGTIADLLNGIGQKFGGKSHKINTSKTEHGAVTAPTSANAHVAASTEKFEAGVNYYTCDSSGRYTKAAVTAGTEIPKNPVYYVATDPVTFTVSPDKGYTVDKIEIKFLLKGSDTYKTYEWTQGSARGIVSNGSGSFSFVMPEADVTITVTFKEGTGEGGSDSTTEPNIDDLITEAGDSAQEDDEEIMREDSTKDVFETIGVKYNDSSYVKTEDQHFHPDSTYYIKGDDGKYTRAQVTADAEVGTDKDYYQRTGSIMLEVSKVDAGRKIEVFVNPASGKVVKSVTATYKTLFVPAGGQYEANETYYLLIDGDYVKQTITKFEDMDSSKTYYVIDQDNPREVTETIEKTNGKYIYTIPYGTKNGAMAGDNSLFFSILITAEFGDPDPTATGSEESAGTEAQTAQSAGALAAGVNINTNNARITTTGKIKAGGTVTVSANASAIATIQADGTAVGPDAASSEPEKEDQPEAGAVTAAQDIIP